MVDTDEDDVRDSEDACDQLDGDWDVDPAFSGCPTLPRTITVSYDGGTISGAVSAASGACEQAQAISVFRVPEAGPGDGVVETMTGVDGSFSVSLPLPADAQFVVEAPRALDAQGRGICGGGQGDPSRFRATPMAWTASWISVPTWTGRRRTRSRGARRWTRTVTASYADAEVTGLVSSPDRPDACADEVTLEAASWAPDGTQQPPVRFSSEAERDLQRWGRLGLPARVIRSLRCKSWTPSGGDCVLGPPRRGWRFRATAMAWTATWTSVPSVDGPKDVAYFPGCPRLARTVTAAYAEAAITGQVSVLGPNAASGRDVSADRGARVHHARRGGGAGGSDHDHVGDGLLHHHVGGALGSRLDVLRAHRALPPRARSRSVPRRSRPGSRSARWPRSGQ